MAVDIRIAPGSTSWLGLVRLAKLLSSLTLAWLGIEGTIGAVTGILAGSIALVAFGLDSAIEVASVIVIWRFTGSRTVSQTLSVAHRNGGLSVSSYSLPTWLPKQSKP